ncbi:MAG: peptide chain release factor N(5)-glutamine methyltransferase [Candidatus Margulisbacteria bacterium]|jgi:release factor glutamine methyltransferase|nr:peptide chain release factor N(5)-glutamine methyltransferase [Candidatus Margulisiibacteriota bacterium]
MSVPEKLWTILAVLKWSADFLRGKGVEAARHDAESLLGFALGLSRLELYLRFDQPLTVPERQTYKKYLQRRARREPLQYITGEAYFLGEKFKATPAALIPRYDTEVLAETVLRQLTRAPHVLELIDVGAGSGILPVIFALKSALRKIYALDISKPALALARENAQARGVAAKIEFLHSDLLTALIHQPVAEDIFLVSNPPYIAPAEYLQLAPEVRDYEPRLALAAEDNGLFFYKKILAQAVMFGDRLKGVFFEVGYRQAAAVRGLLQTRFDQQAQTVQDLGGNDRVVYTLL